MYVYIYIYIRSFVFSVPNPAWGILYIFRISGIQGFWVFLPGLQSSHYFREVSHYFQDFVTIFGDLVIMCGDLVPVTFFHIEASFQRSGPFWQPGCRMVLMLRGTGAL